MTALDRFESLIVSILGESGETETGERGCERLLTFAQRSLHIGLHPERNEATISAPVFCTDEGPHECFPELIADFNAYHLFKGGYRLSLEPYAKCIYASTTRSLDSLEKIGMVVIFADFIDRCISCTQWCASRRQKRAEKPGVESPRFDDMAIFAI